MKVYTDGSSRGNPGPGGWGVVAVDDNDEVVFCYGEQEEQTTNNRMELRAIAYAFYKFGVKKSAAAGDEIPDIYSDSSYAVNTLTSWMFSWAQNNWIKSDKKVPENLDIIKPMYDYWQKGYRMKLHKIKGHAGYEFNELADQIAKGEKLDF